MKIRTGIALIAAALLALVSGMPAEASKRKPRPQVPWVILNQAVTASFLTTGRDIWRNAADAIFDGSLEQTPYGCIYLRDAEGYSWPAIFAPGTKWESNSLDVVPFDDSLSDLSPGPLKLGQPLDANYYYAGAVEDIQSLPFKITQQCMPKDATNVLFIWGFFGGFFPEETLQ